MSRRFYLLLGLLIAPFSTITFRIANQHMKRPRVRVVVTNENDEVLLLKDVIGNRQWTLPGGGINRNEEYVDAARRELMEESGIDVPTTKLKHVDVISMAETGLAFDAIVYSVKVQRSDLPKELYNPFEIAEIAWHSSDALPEKTAKLVHGALRRTR